MPWLPYRFPVATLETIAKFVNSAFYSEKETRTLMIVFGLDGGIASVGWAVIDTSSESATLHCGVRMFDAPETDKERTPTAAVRRGFRGQRRVIRRRRQRMNQVRAILADTGLLPTRDRDALRLGIDPWQARAAGIECALSATEFAAALGHIARHRGFKSNSKRQGNNDPGDETSKMKKAIAENQGKLAQWRTVGEMMARAPEFASLKRNRDGGFSHSLLRDDQEAEVRSLFNAQRRFGNPLASEDLEQAYTKAAFYQRPLQDSEALLGLCPFEPGQKRTTRRSYSFELFRLLSRLNNLKLLTQDGPRPLTPDQVASIAADFGHTRGISFASIRRTLGLTESIRFSEVDRSDEAKRDVVARTGGAAEGTYTLRQLLPDGWWRGLLARPELLDRIAEIITFRDAPERIRAGLEEANVDPIIIDLLMEAVNQGKFSNFGGTGHISAKAARAIIPGLRRGLVYSEACAEAGYNHAESSFSLEDIRNATVRRAVGEMIKQVRAMAQCFGHPDLIHVELARDIGKSSAERDKISNEIEKKNKERDKHRAELEELLSRQINGEELLRYELWKEQNGRCLYTDTEIHPLQLAYSDNSVQIDHILPWSRFGDDSFVNKTLCLTSANQNKRGRTPYEWFKQERTVEEWECFSRRVEDCKSMKGRKKRGFYLRQNAQEVEDNFRNRNLSDTRYAARLLLGLLDRQFGAPGERRVLARPGALTAKLRRAWGLEGLKKDENGKRLEDDRNHAVDACVVAATSESLLQQVTKAVQEAETRGFKRDFTANVPEPFIGFRAAVLAAREQVFVSRSERRRARGQAHDATIRQVTERDGKPAVYARKSILTLKKTEDLENLKDVERNQRLRQVLQDWIDAGKPAKALPRWPVRNEVAQAEYDGAVAEYFPAEWAATTEMVGAERREARRLLRRRFEAETPDKAAALSATVEGAEIRHVMLKSKDKPALMLRGGTAQRGSMVRVDVFREAGKKGKFKYHLVPIYVHQIADKARWPKPPNLAVVAAKEENEWTCIDGFQFMFSLYSNSLIEVIDSNGLVTLGYFRGLHRGTGAITIASVNSAANTKAGIGAKMLCSFKKFDVSRLGNVSEITSEVRTWHGVACT